MNTQELINTARALVANDKGLLAMDESNPTCNKRFAKQGIPQTEEARRAYRELIITTPCLGECISGAILYDETIRQRKKDGTLFIKAIIEAGIVPGIKVDTGAKDLAGDIRRENHRRAGRIARPPQRIFSNGRPLCQVARGDHRSATDSQPGLHRSQCAGAGPLRRIVPGSGAVPVVEPEVLMDGDHTLIAAVS